MQKGFIQLNSVKPKLDQLQRLTSSYWVLLFFFLICTSCKDDKDPGLYSPIAISHVALPSHVDLPVGGELEIQGIGFQESDQVTLTSANEEQYSSLLIRKSDVLGVFKLPKEVKTATYEVALKRGEESLLLGNIRINIVAQLAVPDKEGMTIKGVVYCDGVGVSDVVVSDGVEVAITDKDGIYYLPSKKEKQFVFVSIPGGYEVEKRENQAKFFARLSGGEQVEQVNFSLSKVDNKKHILLTMADLHLADRNNDLKQFSQGFVTDINSYINKRKAEGVSVYGITLGDLSWDGYWYSNKFALPEFTKYMNGVQCTVFHTMGNHDNDPYVAADWFAEEAYRTHIGPTYYSFNLGDVHYIVLDNTEYINTGGALGNVGSRNYNGRLVKDQMEWLKKDLATLKDKSTPVVVAMHIPIHGHPSINNQGEQTNRVTLQNGNDIMNCLSDFKNVHVLSGHTHINYTVLAKENITEHNTAAVCATWWWTGRDGYANNHICRDGSPGGYGVWDIDGTNLMWSYKGIGFEDDYQFRAYDLNQTLITAEKFAPNSTDEKLAPYAKHYAVPNTKNEVLINVWGYNDQWKVEVSENGKALEVKRVKDLDPLHIISYEAMRLNKNATPTDAFVSTETVNLFKVQASSPNSSLSIKVTDQFGRTYTEEMERPKEFSHSIK